MKDKADFVEGKSEGNADLQYVKAGFATIGGWYQHNQGRKRKRLSRISFEKYAELKRLASIRRERYNAVDTIAGLVFLFEDFTALCSQCGALNSKDYTICKECGYVRNKEWEIEQTIRLVEKQNR